MEKLRYCLPPYETKILSFEESGEPDGFAANLRVNIETKEEALAWLAEFSNKSQTSYRVDKSFPENTQKVVFKKRYHCIHNTRPTYHGIKTPHPKHTACNAKVTIKIKKKNMKRSKDVYLKKYPTEIVIQNIHNHLINSDSLRHRPPTKQLKDTFTALFLRGHSPATAYELYKLELEQKHKQNYEKAISDGSICPTKKWCYDLYYKTFMKTYSDPSVHDMINLLTQFVHQYNEKLGENCAAMTAEDGNLIVAICTPLMKRVHQHIKSASEIVFVDSFSCMGRYNSRVFLLLCSSDTGTLPLGAVVTHFESDELISRGIALLQTILPEEAFYGKSGPNVFVTEDSIPLRSSIRKAFPSSALLLCESLVLQAFVKFLWSGINGIEFSDREFMYITFSKLLHIKEIKDFDREFNKILCNQVFLKYNKVINYLRKMKKRSTEWALCERTKFLSTVTNFRVIRDKVLNHRRAYNILQMFDFLTMNYEQFYMTKIRDILNDTYDGHSRCKYVVQEDKVEEKIKNVSCEHFIDNLYRITSKSNEYIFNYDLDICTCPFGSQGASCIHQFAVVKKFGLTSIVFIPSLNSSSKQVLKLLLDCCHDNKSLTSVICKTSNSDCWYDTLDGSKIVARTEEVAAVAEVICKIENDIQEMPDANVAILHSEIDVFCDNIKKGITENPGEFLPAVETFLKNCKEIDGNTTSLVSALNTFGKS